MQLGIIGIVFVVSIRTCDLGACQNTRVLKINFSFSCCLEMFLSIGGGKPRSCLLLFYQCTSQRSERSILSPWLFSAAPITSFFSWGKFLIFRIDYCMIIGISIIFPMNTT